MQTAIRFVLLVLIGPCAHTAVLADGGGARLPVAALDGVSGFTIDGLASEDELGFGVAAAGDVNGDGIDDMILGAPQAEPAGPDSGQCYVVFGRPLPHPALHEVR